MVRINQKYGWLLYLFLLHLMATLPITASPVARIGKVEFHGLQRMTLEEAKTLFGLQMGANFTAADLYQRGESLLSGYSEKHLLFARIDSICYHSMDDSTVAIDVFVNEAKPVYLGTIQLLGIDSMRALQLKSRFETKQGQMIEPKKITADVDDALFQLEKEGFPFCRFDLMAVTVDSTPKKYNGLNLDWKVVTGPMLYLKEVVIKGNKITRPKVILREIRFKPGERFNPVKVGRVSSRLMKTGYFNRVSEPAIYYSSGQDGGMIIEVEEGNASRFDGVVGYVPASSSEKGYFTGLIDISFGNLLGTGRVFQAHWQKRDRKTQDIKLFYREPWVAGYPLHAGLGFMQLIQDTTYVQREIVCDLMLPLFENLSATALVNRIEVLPDSLGSYRFGLLHSRTFNAAVGLQYDSRDDRINPQRGVFYQTMLHSGRKKNYGPNELVSDDKKTHTLRKMTFDFEWYTPVFKRQIFAWLLHGGQLKSNEKNIPLPDQFRLGGAKTLRGYRQDQFYGTDVAWTSLEYRYWLGRRSRVFAFLDYGYYGLKSQGTRQDHYKIGYGLGFRLQTGLGVMSIDYGLGQGDDLFNGKIHVGLINEF